MNQGWPLTARQMKTGSHEEADFPKASKMRRFVSEKTVRTDRNKLNDDIRHSVTGTDTDVVSG
jgi:hypothetical protein